MRLFTLSSDQVLICLLATFANMVALGCKTIAYQNERPGLITLIGYIGLVYAFLIDVLLLYETFGAVELVGVLLVITLNILLIVCGPQQKAKGDDEDDDFVRAKEEKKD